MGLDAVAAPLAGAGGTHLSQFLIFDTLGAVFWCTTYAGLGYIFSDQLEIVAAHIVRLGIFVALAVAGGCGYYIAYKVARWEHFVRQLRLARISPEELRDKLKSGEDILIVDLQGRANNSIEPMAIPGAVRIDPRRLEQYKDIEIPSAQEVVLYSGCPGEFTERARRASTAAEGCGARSAAGRGAPGMARPRLSRYFGIPNSSQPDREPLSIDDLSTNAARACHFVIASFSL